MTREKAFDILTSEGWNKEGAEVIIDSLLEDDIDMLDTLLESELIAISNDYSDR